MVKRIEHDNYLVQNYEYFLVQCGLVRCEHEVTETQLKLVQGAGASIR